MRANIVRGKLASPPSSLKSARGRLKQLQYEMTKIDSQMSDPRRMDEVWRRKAWNARCLFDQEARQIQSWIDKQGELANLLADAYEVLATMKDDGVDFNGNEDQVLHRIDRFLTNNEIDNQNGETEHG